MNKKWEYVESVDIVKKEDLDLVNHLSGKTQKYLKISFKNVQDLMACKLELMPIVKKNKAEKTISAFFRKKGFKEAVGARMPRGPRGSGSKRKHPSA